MPDGYTKVPNAILDTLISSKAMRNAERCIVLYLLRQSFGYNREDTGDFGSVGQIAEATGLSERAVHTALTELRLRGQIVTTRAPRGSMPAAYRVVTPEALTPDHPEVEIREIREITPEAGFSEISGLPEVGFSDLPEAGFTPYKDKEKTKKRQDPPYPPSDSKRWTAGKLYIHLGGRGTIPPLQQPKWIAIGERSDEDLDAAIEKVMDFERPLNRFVELFDLDGADVVPGWERKRQEREAEERKANNGRPPGETDEERWARLAREYGT